jgi:hypothetical protein
MEVLTFAMAATALVIGIVACLLALDAPSHDQVRQIVRDRMAIDQRLFGR